MLRKKTCKKGNFEKRDLTYFKIGKAYSKLVNLDRRKIRTKNYMKNLVKPKK